MEAPFGSGGLSFDVSNTGNGTNEITIYFFYGNSCPHCAIVEPLIDSLAAKYPQIDLKKLEVYHNSDNQALFADFNARHGITVPIIPAVFVEDKALIGDDAITNDLEVEIQRIINANNTLPESTESTNTTNPGDVNNTSTADNNGTIGPPSDNSTDAGGSYPSTKLTVAMVIMAALADSINPCAISVMIFLLIFLTGLGDRKRVFMVGVAYIASAYLAYFIAGLGVLTFLQSSAITRYVYYVAALLSIAIGVINIKDYFSPSKGSTLAIPESRKPMIKKYIEKASVPAAIVLGFSVSLFELPCTGGIYLAILSLLSKDMTMAEGIPYLALYNAIFVLPLVVILALFIKGISAEKASLWRLEKRKSLRLAMGLVMLLLGVVMLLEVA